MNLPNDVLRNILEFDGRFKYENGIYRGIIAKNDSRYSIVDELIKYIHNELQDIVHPYTNKDRWMVTISLTRDKKKKYPIGITIFSNWRYPGEWCHIWINYSTYFTSCGDLPIEFGDEYNMIHTKSSKSA